MKIVFVVVAVLFYARSACSQSCSSICRNFAANPAYCPLLRNRCDNVVVRSYCPLTCNVCKPCSSESSTAADGIRLITTTNMDCQIEGCEDLAPADQCFTIKNVIPNGCSIYPQSCKLSCGQCKTCPIPDPQKECSTDCRDFDNSCEHWKSHGYCNKSSEFYPFTSQTCQKSCGICETCPTPEPVNTALPPIPTTCSDYCEDVDENCNYWNEQGFCNQTDDFPNLLEVCALSCKACKPCPTQAPTLPPCDEECENTNENCEYWQEQGYCDETSEFPMTREVCRKSCGICTACSEEDHFTTTLSSSTQ